MNTSIATAAIAFCEGSTRPIAVVLAAAALVEAVVHVHGADAACGTLPAALKLKYFQLKK